MKRLFSQQIPIYLILILFISTLSCKRTSEQACGEVDSDWVDSLQKVFQYGICIDSLSVTEYPIKSGDNPASIFGKLGFSPAKADSISKASTDVLDPTKLRAGMNYSVFTTSDSAAVIRYIAFAKSMTDFAIIDFTGDSILAYEYNKDISLNRHYAEGTLNSSLWNVLKASGVDPLLAIKISDVFAWQIDFYDVKEGDSFQVLYDIAYIDDTIPLNIVRIEGAKFTHQSKDFYAIPFTQDSIFEYFDEEGNSLRKAFLKAPLDFFRITSRFSNSRFHPVLKRYRAHHGVDYAAPVGTPVKTIGEGTVVARAYENGGGNYVKIKHNSVYTTTYMHLSKFAKGLQVGKRVQQGEVIGYVGSTGLSTGPHLDFRVHKNGQAINPLTMEVPPGDPVKPELRDSFLLEKQRVLAELDSFCINNK
ncbi:murein DD-endopeptidase MepM/ murein hydrolase activator NlpD [Parabacteroides sp. PF5-5]|uniref:peptidoglycan DD-metalloendopeptidase family protein n=1 Tax=unclassified Parabacteroides TaxID=2649774 RepID=UPI002473A2B3|nr:MULTISPECIES: peptidoglycan DD-metalloendopeptidase family protein [unclassified Parabacteroides]MDH6306095.1 murein DD-endopeptidase MepM/ murein hydrolase activator NlpD [Parabacteroides sp. PH5-39]MDH6317007.1 murein DD-endopeptidase MepM/ murein hydrolase activator NlpD [Parabacteroides sp. PF5-13]MDH6320760.1 murein DD-endopeptidase MepM/ murein hydrolase activator NlpD [Parabacteroides sp. PH5-13]MDH6324538.1 murein DD-endopeptidase MepM/ murein hydrolase activator NlpD [Parabacteroide